MKTRFIVNFNSMALHSLYCAGVPSRNCSLTHSLHSKWRRLW